MWSDIPPPLAMILLSWLCLLLGGLWLWWREWRQK